MKIILSRKGFDSGTGKQPSFITSSGDLVSLPIPDRFNAQHQTTYQKVNTPLGLLGPMLPAINARTKGKPPQPILGHALAHLDPDLWQCSIPRADTWIGAYGPRTTGGVNILIKHKVGPGDLFLFFGWFKKLSHKFPAAPVYQPGAPDLHVVFGYLQIEDVYNMRRFHSYFRDILD
jgi:Nucleotide modification associated domain 3